MCGVRSKPALTTLVVDLPQHDVMVLAAEQPVAQHGGRCGLERRVPRESWPHPGVLDGRPGRAVKPAVAPVDVVVLPGLPERALATKPGVQADLHGLAQKPAP